MTQPATPSGPTELYVRNGRFEIPIVFALPRSILVITACPGPCLLLFDDRTWLPIRDKLLSYPMPDDASKHGLINSLRRMLLGNARDILVSARSRIGIDEDLAAFSGIEGRLLWVPGDRHVELWHPSTFDPARRPRMFGQSN